MDDRRRLGTWRGAVVFLAGLSITGCSYSRPPTRAYDDSIPRYEHRVRPAESSDPIRRHPSVESYRRRHGQETPSEEAIPPSPPVRAYQEEYGLRPRTPEEPLGATSEFWLEQGLLHIASGSARSRGVDHWGGRSRKSGAHSPVHSIGVGYAYNMEPTQDVAPGLFLRGGAGWADTKSSGWWQVFSFHVGPRLSLAYGRGGSVYILVEGGAMFWNGSSSGGRGPRSYQGASVGAGLGGVVQINRRWGMGVDVLYRHFAGSGGFDADLVGGSLIWRWRW